MPAADLKKFRALVGRRRRHEPLSHLLGSAVFCGREFKVTPDTLIPRPATETIVEAAVAAAKRQPDAAVFDVGTGSGVIAVTLAKELLGREILATDTSVKALAIARLNARRLGVAPLVSFRHGNLLRVSGLKLQASRPIIVVANLPYIPTADWRKLPPDIKKFEPRQALDGGRDGLDACRALLRQLAGRAGTTIITELLPKQRRPLGAFCRGLFGKCRFETIRNPAGITVGLKVEV